MFRPSPLRHGMLRARRAWLGLAAVMLLAVYLLSDPRARVDSLLRSALGGDVKAQRELGIAYADGVGVARDDARALHWLSLAADQNDAPAQNRLGLMLENGQGVAPDDAAAARWYRLAARQGLPRARDNIDFLYMHGRALHDDPAEARRWYRARTFR